MLGAGPLAGLGGHSEIWTATDELIAGRTTFGTARSPWEHYASMYAHAMSGDPTFQTIRQYGGGSPRFDDVLYGMTHPTEANVPDDITLFARPRSGRPHLLRSGVGLSTWMHRYYYGLEGGWVADGFTPRSVDCLVDSRQVEMGLAQLAGLELADVAGHPPRNTRESHPFVSDRPYADWYTDEMLDWVAEADAPMIELMGWPAPFTAALEPLTWTKTPAWAAA